MLKCPKCGSTESFAAHQIVRMDIVVDGNNEFVMPLCGENKESASIYDSETPYGPYTCTKCNQEFDI